MPDPNHVSKTPKSIGTYILHITVLLRRPLSIIAGTDILVMNLEHSVSNIQSLLLSGIKKALALLGNEEPRQKLVENLVVAIPEITLP